MGALRIFNRAKTRKLQSSHKSYCTRGHWPISFPGQHCPLCAEVSVSRALTDMVVSAMETIETQPNRVARRIA